MFIFGFLTAAYFLVALFAMMMTYDEQQQTGQRGLMLKALGFLACLFWPITFMTVLLTTRIA